MDISERLKQAREHLGKTQREMAATLGCGYKSLQTYEAGGSTPGGNVIAAWVGLGFNSNWLLTGAGSMLLDSGSGSLVLGDGEYVRVPRYEVAASAGGGAFIESEQIVDYLTFRAEWVRNALGVALNQLALINVIGDSMEPFLSEGDVVLLDLSQAGVRDSSIYVIQLDGSLLVKRIQRKLDGSLVVKSDNPRYDPETVAGDAMAQLKIIGRVVWVGRRL